MTPAWAQWVIALSLILSAVGGAWRFIVKPLLRTAVNLEKWQSQTMPTLEQIATDFSNGGSLKKRLDAQDRHLSAQDANIAAIQEDITAIRKALPVAGRRAAPKVREA